MQVIGGAKTKAQSPNHTNKPIRKWKRPTTKVPLKMKFYKDQVFHLLMIGGWYVV